MDSTMDQYRTAPDTLGGRYMRLFGIRFIGRKN
jgi:hypothetical protein